ncbi:hypothetical protein GDO86_003772 [Hymenochirus boettgeri]|uniref:GAS2-like protein 2 n=1 Tax=Hymenochirus boettgeri TaxID=247094 RepID=A0A8T2KB24_9PIPI|nr:hypothetical protein GDO86_003772 [Hymenochirus boettgeri]
MKEDLAEWLKDMYNLEITVNNFIEILENGSVLCQHANDVTGVAQEFSVEYPSLAEKLQLPKSGVKLNMLAQSGTFLARDNVSNFINWCRKEMDIKDVLMFETEDLVLRKNEKNFVLCLLEVARRASRFGMNAPILIQMEEQIEEEIREEMDLPPQEISVPKPQKKLCDFKNLDQMVQHLVSRCTCPVQFSMIKVSEGKYKVGESNTLIFVRILRNHVMVRVGGGWDTLEHYLDKHDPCRCTSLSHKPALKLGSSSKQVSPVHEVRTRLTPRSDNPSKLETMLIVNRSQSPLPPVEWRTYSSGRRTLSSSNLLDDNEKSPNRNSQQPDHRRSMPSSYRVCERSATPSRRQLFEEDSQDAQQLDIPQSIHYRHHLSTSSLASQLTGSEEDNSSASEILSESQRKPIGKIQHLSIKEPVMKDVPLSHTQTVNSAVQSAAEKNKPQQISKMSTHLTNTNDSRPKTPSRLNQPTANKQISFLHREQSKYVEHITRIQKKIGQASVQQPEVRSTTPCRISHSSSQYNAKSPATEKIPSCDYANSKRSVFADQKSVKTGRSTPTIQLNKNGITQKVSSFSEGVQAIAKATDHSVERECMYTPLPIDPEEEKQIYRSLEDEILSNIKVLEGDENNNLENKLRNPILKSSVVDNNTMNHFILPGTSTCTVSSSTNALQTLPGQQGVPRSGVYINTAWQSGPNYDDVIKELSKSHVKLNRVDVENWISKIPVEEKQPTLNGICRNEHSSAVTQRTIVRKKINYSDSKGNKIKQLPSQRARQLALENRKKTLGIVSESKAAAINDENDATVSEKQKVPQGSKPKRCLKKPERVPSIYKLKLRPKIRPRRDNRPEKKPSRIPTPVSYRQVPSKNNDQVLKGTPKYQTNYTVTKTLNESHSTVISSQDPDSDDDAWSSEPSAPFQATNPLETPVPVGNNTERTEEDEESWV